MHARGSVCGDRQHLLAETRVITHLAVAASACIACCRRQCKARESAEGQGKRERKRVMMSAGPGDR